MPKMLHCCVLFYTVSYKTIRTSVNEFYLSNEHFDVKIRHYVCLCVCVQDIVVTRRFILVASINQSDMVDFVRVCVVCFEGDSSCCCCVLPAKSRTIFIQKFISRARDSTHKHPSTTIQQWCCCLYCLIKYCVGLDALKNISTLK